MTYDRGERAWHEVSRHTTRREARAVAEVGFFGGAAVAGPLDEELAHRTDLVHGRERSMTIDRKSYRSANGAALERDMATWTKDMKILDAGAGEARFFRALRDERSPGELPHLVAVAGERPASVTDADLEHIAYYEGLLGAPEGKLEARLGHGSFDRIIDTYGASHYADQFDQVIESYGKLLKPGGRAFLHIVDGMLRIEDEPGVRVEVEAWLARVKGFKVVSIEPNEERGFALVLERTRGKVAAPKIALYDLFHHGAPVRFYRPAAGKGETVLRRPYAR
jgi:SAM-dependent methyltransferase